MKTNMRKTKRMVPAPKPGKYVYEYILHVNALGQLDGFIGKNKYLFVRDDGNTVFFASKGQSPFKMVKRERIFKITKETLSLPYICFLRPCMDLYYRDRYLKIQQGEVEMDKKASEIYDTRYFAPLERIFIYSYQNVSKKEIDKMIRKDIDVKQEMKEKLHILGLEERNTLSHIKDKRNKMKELCEDVKDLTIEILRLEMLQKVTESNIKNYTNLLNDIENAEG